MKNNKYSKPLCSKSRIVILGNFEYRRYQKSEHYTPVLKYISLCLLKAKSVGYKIMLQQGGSEKDRQDTKGNPFHVRLSREKRQR